MPDLVEVFFPHVACAEGGIPHLYLDSVGHLTIGYGHLVFHRDNLKKGHWQKFLRREMEKIWPYNVVTIEENRHNLWADGVYVPASRQRIPGAQRSFVEESPNRCDVDLAPGPWGLENPLGLKPGHNVRTMADEAEKLLMMPYGDKKPAAGFAFFTSFEIGTKADMVRLAHDDIRLKIAEVKRQPNFKDFDAFPLVGQMAVLDLAYQGGAGMIAAKYKKGEFGKAVKERRWYDAYKLCPGDEEGWPPWQRQQTRRAWLIEALYSDPKSDVGNRYMYNNEALGFPPENLA